MILCQIHIFICVSDGHVAIQDEKFTITHHQTIHIELYGEKHLGLMKPN